MRTGQLLLGLALVIGSGLGAFHPALAEEYRGTQEQQAACMPDVWRLCSSQIPDVDRIVACLRANRPSLSDGCRAVFAGPPPEREPRGRRAPPREGVPQPDYGYRERVPQPDYGYRERVPQPDYGYRERVPRPDYDDE